jgi:phosphatidylethanolamine/phosphatidyl-N-methylethanolamine N-methyltransferase
MHVAPRCAPPGQTTMTILSFFAAWLANPRSIGAIVPSSAALAEVITADLSPDSAPVIELGPGTGVVTRSIIARGIAEDRLALIECDDGFATRLRRRFPVANVLRMDATRLKHVKLFGGTPAGAVISGIPLRLMGDASLVSLLDGAFTHLRPDGAFYQFTYGRDAPVASSILERLGLEATRVGAIWANIPPAAVYRICRRQRSIAATHRLRQRADAGPTNAAAYRFQDAARSQS